LATSHVNANGIYLWANRSQFTNVSLRRLPDQFELKVVGLPGLEGEDGQVDVEEEEGHDSKPNDLGEYYKSPEQLVNSMISMTLEPKSRWQNLLYLDAIKV
jgi:U3 small nucleolar RNA-associated protein 21